MWGVLNDHNFTLNVFPKDGGTHCTKMASPLAESGSLFTNVDNAIASNFFLSTDSTSVFTAHFISCLLLTIGLTPLAFYLFFLVGPKIFVITKHFGSNVLAPCFAYVYHWPFFYWTMVDPLLRHTCVFLLLLSLALSHFVLDSIALVLRIIWIMLLHNPSFGDNSFVILQSYFTALSMSSDDWFTCLLTVSIAPSLRYGIQYLHYLQHVQPAECDFEFLSRSKRVKPKCLTKCQNKVQSARAENMVPIGLLFFWLLFLGVHMAVTLAADDSSSISSLAPQREAMVAGEMMMASQRDAQRPSEPEMTPVNA